MTPSDKTPHIPQSISEINTILDKALESKTGQKQGRVYLHIDTQLNQVSLTPDKKFASSRKEIATWMHRISEHTLQTEDIKDVQQFLSLRLKFKSLANRLNKETGLNFFEKIAKRISNFILGTETLLTKTKANLQNKRKDLLYMESRFQTQVAPQDLEPEALQDSEPEPPPRYGTKVASNFLIKDGKKVEAKITKTIDYAKYAEEKLQLEKMKEIDEVKGGNIDYFKKINDSPYLAEMQDLLHALDNELFQELKPIWSKDKAAIPFVTGIFEDVLEKISDEMEQLTPERALENLQNELKTQIRNKNKVVLELDRSAFKDLVGNRVKGGVGLKVSNDISVSSPEVKELIEAYKNKSWKANQQKTLTYDLMDKRGMNKMNAALDKIFAADSFRTALLNYFAQIKSES